MSLPGLRYKPFRLPLLGFMGNTLGPEVISILISCINFSRSGSLNSTGNGCMTCYLPRENLSHAEDKELPRAKASNK